MSESQVWPFQFLMMSIILQIVVIITIQKIKGCWPTSMKLTVSAGLILIWLCSKTSFCSDMSIMLNHGLTYHKWINIQRVFFLDLVQACFNVDLNLAGPGLSSVFVTATCLLWCFQIFERLVNWWEIIWEELK